MRLAARMLKGARKRQQISPSVRVTTELRKKDFRLRLNYDLRNSENDNSQRIHNALELGTVMPVHRRMKASETICMVRKKMVMRFYDDNGNLTDGVLMAPINSGE